MKYALVRERDGAGDSGPMSDALWLDENNVVQFEHDARPRVGVAMKVGTYFARTMSTQDWWMTTPITEILEDEGDRVRFRTGNSVYVWKAFE